MKHLTTPEMTAGAPPSRPLVLQRIRNRIMEYLDLASDPVAHARFGPDAVVNYWEDWQAADWAASYPDPVFTAAEREAMAAFDAAWRVAAATPDPMPPLEQLTGLAAWQQLVAAAGKALSVFNRRGRLDEECEEAP